MLGYFNYKRINSKYLLTNDLGRYIFLTPSQFRELLEKSSVKDEKVRERLKKNAFIYSESREAYIEEFYGYVRDAKNYLLMPAQLHIFVVTTACNMHCVYCQARKDNHTPNGFMTKKTAKKAVDLALQSPVNDLTFEFQGGEPLLNFEIIRYIVEYSEEVAGKKSIRYALVSNLTLLDEKMLLFMMEHHVEISTSLDGYEALHNENRPFLDGKGSFSAVMEKIMKIREKGLGIGAIQTTTRESLASPKKIVDAYLKAGFGTISLRALTPLGCANKVWDAIGYEPEDFLKFYDEAFEYILEINLKGKKFSETIASLMLKKIITGVAPNYMELRSPCGASVGQMAYYYDGKVYTCDEGRMIAEMGNPAFLLGTVDQEYDELLNSGVCRSACMASILESLPSCSDCVYQPYCGVCPAVNYALYGDVCEKRPRSYRCIIYGGILDILFNKLQEDDYSIRQVFRSWIE